MLTLLLASFYCYCLRTTKAVEEKRKEARSGELLTAADRCKNKIMADDLVVVFVVSAVLVMVSILSCCLCKKHKVSAKSEIDEEICSEEKPPPSYEVLFPTEIDQSKAL